MMLNRKAKYEIWTMSFFHFTAYILLSIVMNKTKLGKKMTIISGPVWYAFSILLTYILQIILNILHIYIFLWIVGFWKTTN
jgi:hypothetical protein